ncbi:MAG: hypothetical protein AAF614_10475 [Chloroflexota bacterium]
MMTLYVATRTGLVMAEEGANGWRETGRSLTNHHVTTLIAREGVILAGTTDGIFRSADGGQQWGEVSNGLTERHVRWLAFHPEISDLEFAGTEPAAIFVSNNGGDSWQERPEVAELRDKFGWWLPYSPEAGCVRGFAFHGQRVYGAVEVGGALRSDDGGKTWDLAPGSDGRPVFTLPSLHHIQSDVHAVKTHPDSPDLVYAPTSGGFFASEDGGAQWDLLYPDCYVRAVWVDPIDRRRMVLGPSQNSSGRNGRIEVTHDGGETWEKTAVSWRRNMVERFRPLGNHLFAILANGELLQTELPTGARNLAGIVWTATLPSLVGVNDVAHLD